MLGLDLNNVTPSYRNRNKLEGNLFDLPEIANKLSDRPELWIKNVHMVELWAHDGKYNTHGVNYFRMQDGRMILNTPRIILPAEDTLWRILFNGRLKPTQKVVDTIYSYLLREHGDKRALWDFNLVKCWGTAEATEKQKRIIKRKFPQIDVEYLTKLEANQILTRCFCV